MRPYLVDLCCRLRPLAWRQHKRAWAGRSSAHSVGALELMLLGQAGAERGAARAAPVCVSSARPGPAARLRRITMTTLHMREGRDACAWERYQHRTADLLRELGFTAAVKARCSQPGAWFTRWTYPPGSCSPASRCSGSSSTSCGTGRFPKRKCLRSVPSKMRERPYVPFCR